MTTIRLIYGNIEEKYNPESYDLFEELIQYVNIYFGFLERKFSVLLADDDGVPIFPTRTIFNSQQIT